jgi:hypothetical protein
MGGRVIAQPVDGRSEWKVGAIVGQGPSEAVRDDWVVASLETDQPIGAAEIALVKLNQPAEVTVLSHFQGHAEVAYANVENVPSWHLGLRWPRAGLCQAVDVKLGCLQMFCQTVEGFSGSPIFRVRSEGGDARAPLEVVGFVSRPGADRDAQCGIVPTGTTTAVSAAEIS